MLKAKMEAIVDQVERDRPDCSVPQAQSLPVSPSGWQCLLSEERYFCKNKRKTKFTVRTNCNPVFEHGEQSAKNISGCWAESTFGWSEDSSGNLGRISWSAA